MERHANGTTRYRRGEAVNERDDLADSGLERSFDVCNGGNIVWQPGQTERLSFGPRTLLKEMIYLSPKGGQFLRFRGSCIVYSVLLLLLLFFFGKNFLHNFKCTSLSLFDSRKTGITCSFFPREIVYIYIGGKEWKAIKNTHLLSGRRKILA